MFKKKFSRYMKNIPGTTVTFNSGLTDIMKINFLILCINWKTSTDYSHYRFTYYDALEIFEEQTKEYHKDIVDATGLFIFDDRYHNIIMSTIVGGKDLYLSYAMNVSLDPKFYDLIDSYFQCRGE